MIKHLFKMIWNKKKQNSLLIVEILLSFLVIFGVFSYGLNAYRNYARPMGINYNDVWAVGYNHTLDTQNPDSVTMVYENLLKTIKAMPQVVDAGYHTNNVPFSTNHMSGGLKYKGEVIYQINQYQVDQNFPKVMGATMAAGRWYNKADEAQQNKVVVINQFLKEKMFGKEDAIGKSFGDWEGKNPVKIIGVINNIKHDGDFQKVGYERYGLRDTAAYKWMGKILVKVVPGTGADFEGKLYKLMANTMKKSNIEIQHLDNMLTAYNKFTVVPLIIMLIVASFLIINVALGIFGVLWYNINKRRGEIGLRRAVGATGSGVSKQLVSEALVLTTLSLIIGTFFAVQFPLLNVFDLPAVVYVNAILLAIVFIYLLVLVCSLYPGKQAAAVLPAVALHEE